MCWNVLYNKRILIVFQGMDNRNSQRWTWIGCIKQNRTSKHICIMWCNIWDIVVYLMWCNIWDIVIIMIMWNLRIVFNINYLWKVWIYLEVTIVSKKRRFSYQDGWDCLCFFKFRNNDAYIMVNYYCNNVNQDLDPTLSDLILLIYIYIVHLPACLHVISSNRPNI